MINDNWNPHEPSKAKVGRLYELQITPFELSDLDPITYYVYDTQGNTMDKEWEYTCPVPCLVLRKTKIYVVVLVGEDIVHLEANSQDHLMWQVALVPLNQT